MINKNACQRVPLLKCTRVSVIKSALVRVLNSKRKLAPRRVSRRLRRLWRWTLCWGEETCVSVRVLIEEQKNKIKNQSLETPLTVYIINVPFIMLQWATPPWHRSSSSDESPGVGLSLNRSQHDAALPSTTPRQERKSSTDYSEPRHRTEVNSDLRSRDARVKRTASISAIQMGFDVAPHVVKRD